MIAAVLASAALVGPTSVGVSAREFRFGVYREWVPRGAVTFVVHNYGEDDHDLVVTGPGRYRSARSPDIEPGATVRVPATLRRRGRYRLICLKPGHLARGMRATLRVR